MITNTRFTLYRVSDELYGVSSTDHKLSQELNRALGYRKYPKGTRFKEYDEPLFHFTKDRGEAVLGILGLINVELSSIQYPHPHSVTDADPSLPKDPAAA